MFDLEEGGGTLDLLLVMSFTINWSIECSLEATNYTMACSFL